MSKPPKRRGVGAALERPDPVALAASAKAAASRGEPLPDAPAAASEGDVTTGINLPKELHALLRAVALKRQKERKGRASVSGVIVDLIREREPDLRAEAGRYLELIDLL